MGWDAMTPPTWRERLAGRMPEALAEEIDVFETQMTLRRAGKLEEKIFAETRLRRGIYGQRYGFRRMPRARIDDTLTLPSRLASGAMVRCRAQIADRFTVAAATLLSPRACTTTSCSESD